MHAYSKKYWKQDKEVLEELEKTNDQVAHLSRYVNHYGGFSVYKNTSARYFPSGEEKFKETAHPAEKKQRNLSLWNISLWQKAICGECS